MKLRIFLILIIAISVSLNSCDDQITASGNVTQETYLVSNYDEIHVSHAFEANIIFTPAGEEGIIIEADDNVQQYVEVKVTNNNLYIDLDDHLDLMGPVTLHAIISTSNQINAVFASGASVVSFTDIFSGNDLILNASGASSIIGEINAGQLQSTLSGASTFELSGVVDAVNADLSGASTLEGFDLTVQDLVIDLSGASVARLTIDNSLDVDASGASTVFYKGDGLITHQNLSGASQIIHLD